MDRCHAGIAAGILVMAVMSVSCKGGKSIFDKNTTYDIPVKVMTAGESESTGVRSYVGTAAAEKSAVLSCRYPGRVVKLDVRKGEYVKAGDVLAEVESQNVLSTWTMSHSSLEQARDGYDRARKVHQSGSMADVKMVEVETKLAQAEAAAKALGTGFRNGIYLKDIQTKHNTAGKPELMLSGGALRRLQTIGKGSEPTLHLSVSDDYPFAQAVVIIEII